jgi:hypothetical protein
MTQSIFIAPDSAAVVDGYLIPGQIFITAIVGRLREDMRKDPALEKRFQEDPRTVLAERGIVKDLQTELLLEQGLPVAEAKGWCISTGSCCCETW